MVAEEVRFSGLLLKGSEKHQRTVDHIFLNVMLRYLCGFFPRPSRFNLVQGYFRPSKFNPVRGLNIATNGSGELESEVILITSTARGIPVLSFEHKVYVMVNQIGGQLLDTSGGSDAEEHWISYLTRKD